ncbi:hypothetical protein BD626DRAFT_535368 [Schizophyllum amplum]|uniref:RRM domain-containing protein n=1 Tax=Schizophyllum amplum TaxID=97359 RepID=A0A550CM76_9AGAR|nr:hypothetical protein BD626DRAFT_535368 [Auriculariopsis ampla]
MTDTYDPPYTTPEEDPFNIAPVLTQQRRKRSSLLDKWILEQRRTHSVDGSKILDLTDDRAPSPAPHANAYLAYPDLAGRATPLAASRETVDSYDMVEDEDIVNELASLRVSSDCEAPPTPNTQRSRNSKLLHSPTSSFRSFHFSFRSSHSSAPGTSPPSTPSRRSLFPRLASGSGASVRGPSTASRDTHKRSASASVVEVPSPPPHFTGPSKLRPSVLGHFPSASQVSVPPSDTAYTPSRPSMSSHTTCTSTTPTSADDELTTPMKPSFVDSVRIRSKSHGASSMMSFSGWSQRPESPPTVVDGAPSDRTERYSSMSQRSGGSTRGGSARIPFAPKSVSRLANNDVREANKEAGLHMVDVAVDPNRPHVIYAPNTRPSTLSRVSFHSRSKRKTLVISGITAGDMKRFEGVRRWCENFGAVTQILRMPNGDLHVHFQSGDVADTVCRLRAKVFISGVGSVQLSFLTGGK